MGRRGIRVSKVVNPLIYIRANNLERVKMASKLFSLLRGITGMTIASAVLLTAIVIISIVSKFVDPQYFEFVILAYTLFGFWGIFNEKGLPESFKATMSMRHYNYGKVVGHLLVCAFYFIMTSLFTVTISDIFYTGTIIVIFSIFVNLMTLLPNPQSRR